MVSSLEERCLRPEAGPAARPGPRLWLVRHGETEWSRSGRHTGKTNLPLTESGINGAENLRRLLGGRSFAVVLSSPLLRAVETCRLAGYSKDAQIDPNLQEWDYGDYEGLITSEIQEHSPGWSIWRDGAPGGETIQDVATRAQSVINRVAHVNGDVLLFAHGHVLRILTTAWLTLPAETGRHLALDPASLSVLGYERETRVISHWNALTLDSG